MKGVRQTKALESAATDPGHDFPSFGKTRRSPYDHTSTRI
jgi:hypothetical protein